jgi:hypothetical protein
LEKIIHIIPLGIEYDRATIPFKGKDGFKANRAYILTTSQPHKGKAPSEIIKEHREKAEKVKAFLEKQNIEVIVIETNLIDLLDVMKKISNIIHKEKESSNHIYINVSSAGRLTSIAAALAGMFHNVKSYYVKADRYSKTKQERKEHGITISEKRDILFLENFELLTPNELEQKVIVEIHEKGKLRTIDIIQYLSKSKVKGFTENYFEKRRPQKTALLMKLNRRIMDKLEKTGYIKKTKIGRENEYELTKSCEYIANLCGLIPINPKKIHNKK